MLTLKAQIAAAIAAGTATMHDDGKAVLHNGLLYTARKGGTFQRMKAQKENRRRLGITLAPPAPPVNVAPSVAGVKVIIGPAAVRYGKAAHAADFIRYARRMGIIA
jgi:hypothetical protein